ncbi:hypothetical protein AMR41_29080 [Hapalosiphon sp. MRB220]|nr:hypothetical protein AMR41_29080 [Hapalosiphon sp. MRB220]
MRFLLLPGKSFTNIILNYLITLPDLKAAILISQGITSVLSFLYLVGWFRDSDKKKILDWLLSSDNEFPFEERIVRKFVKKFPLPENESESTYSLSKMRVLSPGGGVLSAAIRYVREDSTVVKDAATLDEIRKWSEETPYGWLVFTTSFIGFTITFFSYIQSYLKQG